MNLKLFKDVSQINSKKDEKEDTNQKEQPEQKDTESLCSIMDLIKSSKDTVEHKIFLLNYKC